MCLGIARTQIFFFFSSSVFGAGFSVSSKSKGLSSSKGSGNAGS